MALSSTARVILGMLAVAPRSGYDIKAVSDRSTRFFWAASYGQIYPELKRLAEDGLIEPVEEDEGGRRRTSYALTGRGREAVSEWMESQDLIHELRDEGLLKLFFAGVLGTDELLAVLERKRAGHEAELARLREIEPFATTAERFGPLEVLHYGISMHEMAIRWCDDHLDRLRKEAADANAR